MGGAAGLRLCEFRVLFAYCTKTNDAGQAARRRDGMVEMRALAYSLMVACSTLLRLAIAARAEYNISG